jgi:hypothetical protein
MRRRRANRTCPYLNRQGLVVNVKTETLRVIVGDRDSMDRCLDVAVDKMVAVALKSRRHGILVTRLGDGHFTVGLSDEVPFGYTEQLDGRHQSF